MLLEVKLLSWSLERQPRETQLTAATISTPQFPFSLLHEIPGPSSFLSSAVCIALRLPYCNKSHIYLTLNLYPWSPPCPRRLHDCNSYPLSCSSFPICFSLGLGRIKQSQLGHICVARPAKWYICCHQQRAWHQCPCSLMGQLTGPSGLWRGHTAPTLPQHPRGWASRLTDNMLHSFLS